MDVYYTNFKQIKSTAHRNRNIHMRAMAVVVWVSPTGFLEFHFTQKKKERKNVHTYCVYCFYLFHFHAERGTIEQQAVPAFRMSVSIDVTVQYTNTRRPGSLSRDKIKRRNFSSVFSSCYFFALHRRHIRMVSWTWEWVCACVCCMCSGAAFLLGVFFSRIYSTFGAYTLHT